MKKILSILLSVAIILSCVSMVSFAVDGPQSENLLPAEISTFDTNGAKSHESYGEVISGHTSFRDIIDGALMVRNQSWASNGACHTFILAPYIKSYAEANPAESYLVSISVDVKTASGSSASLVLRNSNAGNQWQMNYLDNKTLSATEFVNFAGSFEITSDLVAAAADNAYQLTLEGITPAGNASVYFDNVTLKITPKGIVVPDEPVGLLPTEISTFGSNGVTSHANMGFIGESNRFGAPSIVDGAYFIQKQTGSWVESYTSPAWFMATYMQAFVAENPANEYTVNVSMDVKGNPGSATLAFRNSTAGNVNGMNFFESTASVTSDKFTTVKGTLTLTADQITSASASGFALCLDNLAQGAAIYIDNVVLQMEALKAPDPIGLLPVEISVFDKVGVTSHAHMGFIGESNRFSAPSIVDGAYFIQKQTGSWVESYTSPAWFMAPYMQAFVAENPAQEYIVNVSMDIKGNPGSATLAFRNSTAGNANSMNFFESTASVTSDKFTTVKGTLTLTADQITSAGASGFALCLENLAQGAAIYIDNVVLQMEVIKAPEPIGLLPVEISTFDNGVTSHANMGFIGESNRFGTPSIVDGAYFIQKQTGSWVESYAAPAWYLAPYIKEFANETGATTYLVEISMDVKGTLGTAKLVLRNSNANNINAYGISELNIAEFNADTFTTVTGTVLLTAAQIEEAGAQSYALCFENINAGSTLYIDNIAVNMEAVPSNTVVGASLDLGSTLTMNFYAELDDDHKDATLLVTRNGETVEITEKVFDDEFNMYRYAYTGINPQCMADNISASLKLNGEEISVKADYSVKDYFTNIVSSNPTELGITEDKFNALVELASNTLVFGAEAQKHMGYNLTELATDGLDWIQYNESPLTAPAEIFKAVTNTSADNKVLSATLNISNTVKVMYRVKLTDNNLTVKVNGVEAELIATANANEYLVFATDAKATDFNTPYVITITDGATEISNVTYSVNDYIAYIAAKGNASALYNIVKALNDYGTSAVAFANAL